MRSLQLLVTTNIKNLGRARLREPRTLLREPTVLVRVRGDRQVELGTTLSVPTGRRAREKGPGAGPRVQVVFLAGSAAPDAGQGSFKAGLPALGGPGAPSVSWGASR